MTKRKTPKQTNWFPGHVKPVRKGVYKRLWIHLGGTQEPVFTYWNGEFWGYSHVDNCHWVFEFRNTLGKQQNLAWLGLAQDPETADV